MERKSKSILIIVILCIVTLAVGGIIIFVYRPWNCSRSKEDAVITNIKALQSVDGFLYVYGEDITEIEILRDYENTPYQKLNTIADAPKNSTHAQNCLVISDVDGTVNLSEEDFSYIYSLVYEKNWWLMYMGTNETHISQLVSHKLNLEDEDGYGKDLGFIFKNAQSGCAVGVWSKEDSESYKNRNPQFFVQCMLTNFLGVIKNI